MNPDRIRGMIKEVFADESNRVRLIICGNRIKLEIKNMIHDGVWIQSEQNALDKISELHYDMTCENISWG